MARTRDTRSYGKRLADETSWTPVYLRANTGLPIAENGVALASLLDSLVASWPTGVRRIALVGHSMGGLIMRSACAVVTDAESSWTNLVTDVVTLGTPHLGAPIERGLSLGVKALGRLPEAAPFGRILEYRSVGILDLRAGLAADVQNLPHARYHLVAATLAASHRHPVSETLGDLLVRYPSAVGTTPARPGDVPRCGRAARQGGSFRPAQPSRRLHRAQGVADLMPRPLPISTSVDIDADPERVWSVVGDVARMPEWSPELRRIVVLGRKPVRVGTTLLGLNRRGWAVWPTTSKVTRLEPGRAVAWRTRESGATWTYELEATQTGTRLTGRRDLDSFTIGTTLLGPVIGGAEGHDRELEQGIGTTLGRIKASVETFSRR